MLRLALAACAFDCLLWRRGSKTAAPRAAVPTRGLPAAQKRARRAENEENDVNFYNATRKAESSLQHRTGSPESRCCRDLVQAPVYFFLLRFGVQHITCTHIQTFFTCTACTCRC